MSELIILLLTVYLIPILFTVALYVLEALGLYTMAKRRGIRKSWLSWIPVGDMWILGSLSDQYRYVAKGQEKSRRKVLLTLCLVMAGLNVLFLGLLFGTIFQGAVVEAGGASDAAYGAIGVMSVSALLLVLPMIGVSIGSLVVRYMALYDVYCSVSPENSTLFLVLSIIFSVTEPFFLFFNRNRDTGMIRQLPQNSGGQNFALPEMETERNFRGCSSGQTLSPEDTWSENP